MRERQGFALLLRACAAVVAAAICLVPAAVAQPDVGIAPRPTEKGARSRTNEHIDSQLAAVVAARADGTQAALRAARANGLETVQGRIRVVLEASSVEARSAVAAGGGTVEGTAGRLTEALLPAGSIEAVSTARGIERVRAPYPAYALGSTARGSSRRRQTPGRPSASSAPVRRSPSSTSASRGSPAARPPATFPPG